MMHTLNRVPDPVMASGVERSGMPSPRPRNAQVIATSQGLGWRGVQLEVCSNYGFSADRLMLDGHFVAIHLNPEPLKLTTWSAGGWTEHLFRQNTILVHPRGVPFSARHQSFDHWAGVMIDSAFLDDVMDGHHELNASIISEDHLLTSLLIGLISQVTDRDPQIRCDTQMSTSLLYNLASVLGARYGRRVSARRMQVHGGIAPHRMRLLEAWLSARLGEKLSIAQMAAKVGLSTAHFSREFRQTTGKTPWQYVTEQRLHLARTLLRQGEDVHAVARRCGFADRSHLGRALRMHLGFGLKACRDSGQAPLSVHFRGESQ